jgi:hypothetical protein
METLDFEKGCHAMDQRPGISRPISMVCQESRADKTDVFCGAGKVMTSRNLLSMVRASRACGGNRSIPQAKLKPNPGGEPWDC